MIDWGKATMMTENGISTTTALGSEQYDSFIFKGDGVTFQCTQYDYRHTERDIVSFEYE